MVRHCMLAPEESKNRTESQREKGTGLWWDTQRHVTQSVPAEMVDPKHFDYFNFRYQTYARLPAIQDTSCLANVSDKPQKIRYYVTRNAVDRNCGPRLWPCAGHYCDKPWKANCSKNNNTQTKNQISVSENRGLTTPFTRLNIPGKVSPALSASSSKSNCASPRGLNVTATNGMSDLRGNKNNSGVSFVQHDNPKQDIFIDIFEGTKQENKEISIKYKFIKAENCECRNNNAKSCDPDGVYQLECCQKRNTTNSVDCPGRRYCYPTKPYPDIPRNRVMEGKILKNNPRDDSPPILECRVVDNANDDPYNPLIVCDPTRKPKKVTPGYGTYKLVMSQQYRQHPPEDMYKNVPLRKDLAEYQEFQRRCVDYKLGRYDHSQPLNIMIFPKNKSTTLMTSGLTPFAYMKNPKRASNKKQDFVKDSSNENDINLHWATPAELRNH